MSYSTLALERRDGVLSITLNRPEALNAMTATMLEELAAAVQDAANDAEVRSLLITGAGRAFCAGADMSALQELAAGFAARERLLRVNRTIVLSMRNMEKPIVAAVNGAAAGAGCSLALAADVILAAEDAQFVQAFSRLGLVPDMAAMYFLPRLIGNAKAKYLVFTGSRLAAPEAERIGLVTAVYPKEQLLDEAWKLAAELARGATKALGLAKAILNRGETADLETIIEMEASAQALCFSSEDLQEGARAFLEKRTPQFQGR